MCLIKITVLLFVDVSLLPVEKDMEQDNKIDLSKCNNNGNTEMAACQQVWMCALHLDALRMHKVRWTIVWFFLCVCAFWILLIYAFYYKLFCIIYSKCEGKKLFLMCYTVLTLVLVCHFLMAGAAIRLGN